MTRNEIVARINEKMDGEMYTFDQIKDDLDDAIITINNMMHTRYPYMSDVLTTPQSRYVYIGEDNLYHHIFPDQYIRSVVVEFVISQLYRRQGEFANEFNTAQGAFTRNLEVMFRDLYNKVPEQYIDDSTGMIAITPYEVPFDE